jgi:hypothetical protein
LRCGAAQDDLKTKELRFGYNNRERVFLEALVIAGEAPLPTDCSVEPRIPSG